MIATKGYVEARYWLLAILALSLLARAPYLLASAPLDWDAAAYADNANYFMGTGHYFEAIRAPLLSLLLIPFEATATIAWAPVVFGLLSLAAAFLLFREIAGEKRALVATAILSLSGLFYSWTTQVSVESASILALSLTFLLFIRAAKDKRWLLPAFAASAFAVLLRYYFFVAVLLGIAYYYRETKSTRGMGRGSLLFIAILLPWAAFNYVHFGSPIYSLTQSISIFAGDFPNFKPVDFYLQNWWQIADVVTWALLALGLSQYRRFSRKEWLLAAWAFITLIAVQLAPVKEVRYFVPLLFPIAYFAARPLKTKRMKAVALILIALSGLSVMSYAAFTHAPDPCFHHTGVALAARGLNGTICSTHWPIAAYYSGQPVRKLWYGRDASDCISGADWLVYSPNGDPSLSKEKLDRNPQLVPASSFGPACSKAFLYKITRNSPHSPVV